MPNGYGVVPLNPKTGKVIRTPRREQAVIFAVRGPRGGITKLSKEPQRFYKTDLAGLEKAVKNTKGRNFVVHEEKTNRIKRDEYGHKIFKAVTDKETGELVDRPVYEKKITMAQSKKKQRPVLFVKGKRVRELDIGFKKGNYKEARRMRELTIARTDVAKPVEITLQGPTIKAAMQKLQLDKRLSDLADKKTGRRFGVYYSIIMKIVSPSGDETIVPVNGSESDLPTYMKVPEVKERLETPRHKLSVLANMHSKISTRVRQALADRGLKFTRDVKLKSLGKSMDKQITKMERQGADLSKIEKMGYAADRLQRPTTYTRSKDLKQITKNWSVTLYIRFETM